METSKTRTTLALFAVAVLAAACGGSGSSDNDLPQAVLVSTREAVHRGSAAPQPDALRFAITRYWVGRLKGIQSANGRPLCRSIVEQPGSGEATVPPPPLEVIDPFAPTTWPISVDGRVVETDGCSINIDGPDAIMLSIGPISHWWDDTNTYDVDVFISAVDGIPEFQKHAAMFKNGTWHVQEPVLRNAECPP